MFSIVTYRVFPQCKHSRYCKAVLNKCLPYACPLQGFGANVPSMDISEDVDALASIQQAIGMSASELHQIVIGSDGSMRSIKSAMLQWAQLHKVDTALDASPLRSVIPTNPQVLQSQLHSDGELVQSLSANRALVAEAGKFRDGPTSVKASAEYLVNHNVGHSASRA